MLMGLDKVTLPSWSPLAEPTVTVPLPKPLFWVTKQCAGGDRCPSGIGVDAGKGLSSAARLDQRNGSGRALNGSAESVAVSVTANGDGRRSRAGDVVDGAGADEPADGCIVAVEIQLCPAGHGEIAGGGQAGARGRVAPCRR